MCIYLKNVRECGLDTVRDKRDPRALELTVFTFPHPAADDSSQEYIFLIKTGFLSSFTLWSQFKHKPEAGVLKKLSLAGLAKLSRLRYS